VVACGAVAGACATAVVAAGAVVGVELPQAVSIKLAHNISTTNKGAFPNSFTSNPPVSSPTKLPNNSKTYRLVGTGRYNRLIVNLVTIYFVKLRLKVF
jgi:hypothetical protein